MTARPPLPPNPVFSPSAVDAGPQVTAGVATYRTGQELAVYLRALGQVADGRLVVVLGLNPGRPVPAADVPPHVRLIQTAAGPVPVEPAGWFVPDPVRAVAVGLTGLGEGDGLLLLFPADWSGTPPEELVAAARRWRAGPHRPTDDEYFS
jgi:hypothetical protein